METKIIFNEYLKKYFPNYEERKEQIEMSISIEEAIRNLKHIIVEAGTGVGKSFAYLVPTIINAIKKESSVLISTYTKTLQNQLIKNDLPILNEIFRRAGLPFTYCVFFGSENYLCLRRFNESFSDFTMNSLELEKIKKYIEESNNGLLLDLPFELSEETKTEITRDPDICLSKECKYQKACYYYKAYELLKNSTVVVINHYLFFLNLVSGGRFLPSYDVVVLDEAHNLEDVAFETLGSEITHAKIIRLLNRIYNPIKNRGILTKIKNLPPRYLKETETLLHKIKQQSDEYFMTLLELLPKDKDAFKVNPVILETGHKSPKKVGEALTNSLFELIDLLHSFLTYADTIEERYDLEAYKNKLYGLASEIKLFLSCEMDGYVYWLETYYSKIKKEKKVAMRITPIDISDFLNEYVFGRILSVIMTSATLSVNNNFSYFKETLGIREAKEVILGSPFNYNRVMLYLTNSNYEPRVQENSYIDNCIKETKEILKTTKGSTFILFTSYKLLEEVYESVSSAESSKILKLLRQGEKSSYVILDEFKKQKHTVLFGTSTFWQGVDVPGETLTCIIIPKLPFDVPDHPIIEARQNKMKLEGKNPFTSFMLPRAVLRLKQGFGRLMRRATDWGIVLILDPRIRTKSYGEVFIKSLPKCEMTTCLETVKSFYRKNKRKYSISQKTNHIT